MLGGPRATQGHSLAAVGGQPPTEELHAHNGEGIVEGEQREAKAGKAEGQGQSGQEGGDGAAAARPGLPRH